MMSLHSLLEAVVDFRSQHLNHSLLHALVTFNLLFLISGLSIR
jgi:hypothetical protein